MLHSVDVSIFGHSPVKSRTQVFDSIFSTKRFHRQKSLHSLCTAPAVKKLVKRVGVVKEFNPLSQKQVARKLE